MHERHARDPSLKRFAGWWGHDKTSRFDMRGEFKPIPGIEGWQLSNPPILALAPLVASLDIFRRARMSKLLAKSRKLTGYLEYLVQTELQDAIEIITPAHSAQRGCQLSLRVKSDADKGRKLATELSARGVIVDWREPDVIRASPVPLYNSYDDVFRFCKLLGTLLRT